MLPKLVSRVMDSISMAWMQQKLLDSLQFSNLPLSLENWEIDIIHCPMHPFCFLSNSGKPKAMKIDRFANIQAFPGKCRNIIHNCL